MVRCLSFHARYVCGRSGACCTSSWPIPIESDRLQRLRAATATGRLRPADTDAPFRKTADGHVLGVTRGRCVFLDPAGVSGGGGTTCRIHRALGHDALPLACQQFPRVSVRDPRGVSVTLSHYCPTAARQLTSEAPLAISTAPPAFADTAAYEGLDARVSLPPRLRPDMLMDWTGWWAWEESVIALLADRTVPVRVHLARLALAVETVRVWRPGRLPLADAVGRAFADARATHVAPFTCDRTEQADRLDELTSSMAESRQMEGPRESEEGVTDIVVRHFVAAHAFANWTAHLGAGLRTWLRSVETPMVLLDAGLSIRQADLWLRHLADPTRLADRWSRVEAATSRP